MGRLKCWFLVAAWIALAFVGDLRAVRVLTMPSTMFGDPSLQFDNIALTPNGNTIVLTGLFNEALDNTDRVYSLTVPNDPATQTATITQLSTQSFSVDQNYDVAFPPVISPDGQSILYTHDNATDVSNTIYTMPITGELNVTSFTGLFGPAPNLVSPGSGNANPVFSPDGSTIFFLNSESGFGGSGSIPNFDSPDSPIAFAAGPDWDQLYSVPAGGGTPTAVTSPSDGDIDVGLFAVTPDGASVVYAPDNPVVERKDRDGIRPKLFTIPAAGGTPVEIPVPTPAHEFSITNQLAMTPDGQHVLFIGDYETLGKNELFSVPIGGGAPTRISDNLPFAGDVYSFAIAADGSSIAYAAGQNTSSNTELFLTPVAGGVGNSIRINDPAPSNSGLFDVSTSSEGGQILIHTDAMDSTSVYYLGDLDTEDVNDLYVVDTTEKAGLVPKPFTYVGPDEGEFFNEGNWEDPDGNNPPPGTIDPNVSIRHSLIIDGDSVVATVPFAGAEITFQLGGSLELTPGAMLTSTLAQLEFNPGSGLKLTDATISVREDVILSGTNELSGGLIESFADDVEFQDNHKSQINGTTLRSTGGIIVFDNSATSATGATFESTDRLSLRYEVDVTVTDTTIDVNGGDSDVEDAFAGAQGEGSTLTLKGTSTLLANAFQDGVSLVLDDNSVATLLGADSGVDLVDPNGTITFMSTGAEMITLHASASDVRGQVFNGLTGMSYLDDPSAWNVTDWDGLSPLASLRLAANGVDGDYNGDGTVDAADYTVWRDNLGSFVTLPNDETPGEVTAEDYTVWVDNFGATSGSLLVAEIPEPSAACLCIALMAVSAALGIRRDRLQSTMAAKFTVRPAREVVGLEPRHGNFHTS